MLDFGFMARVIEKDVACVAAQKVGVGVQSGKRMRYIRLPQVVVELFHVDTSAPVGTSRVGR